MVQGRIEGRVGDEDVDGERGWRAPGREGARVYWQSSITKQRPLSQWA